MSKSWSFDETDSREDMTGFDSLDPMSRTASSLVNDIGKFLKTNGYDPRLRKRLAHILIERIK